MEVNVMKKAVFAIVVGVVLALPTMSAARTDRELTYRENEIWHSAIRFLRVDSGFKILEKDRDAGYVLFEYKDGATTCTASLEMVSTARDNKLFVRTRIQIESQPRYVEAVLIDRFVRKLKDEYGDPPPPRAIEPAVKPPAQAAADDAAAAKKPKPVVEGKSMADGEEDPEDKDEDELERSDEDIDRAEAKEE
jgi:hypothetical protein